MCCSLIHWMRCITIYLDFGLLSSYQGQTKEGSFAVGLQGIKESDVDTVLQIIDQTMDKVVK